MAPNFGMKNNPTTLEVSWAPSIAILNDVTVGKKPKCVRNNAFSLIIDITTFHCKHLFLTIEMIYVQVYHQPREKSFFNLLPRCSYTSMRASYPPGAIVLGSNILAQPAGLPADRMLCIINHSGKHHKYRDNFLFTSSATVDRRNLWKLGKNVGSKQRNKHRWRQCWPKG